MKKTITKDYWKYDYISITVKKENAEEIIHSYGVFGYHEIEREEDKFYHDLFHCTLKRSHYLPNKDRLQFLQVQYEGLMNERARLIYRKRYKSRVYLLTALFGSILALVSGIVTSIICSSIIGTILGVVLSVASLPALIISSKKYYSIRKIETENFNNKLREIENQLSAVLNEAEELLGGKE